MARHRPRVGIDQGMNIDSAEFRRIFGHWATGVAIVTARSPDGEPIGLTVNAVTSLSLRPPLAIVCIDRTADSHDALVAAGAFAINILAAGSERLARRFAADERAGRFDGVAWQLKRTGAPVFDDALAWIDCRIDATHEGGDHTVFIGAVVDGDAREGAPLLFYRGGYADLAP